MKAIFALLLSAGLIWAEGPAASPEPTPPPSTNSEASDFEAKIRKQADDLKREMDEKLKDAKAASLGVFEAAKKKLAEAALAAQQQMSPSPTPASTPAPTPANAMPASSPAALPGGKLTSEAISANPENYLGQIVTLTANIKTIEPDRFIIDGDIIVPANMDAFDKRESPRDKIEVKDGSLVRTTVLPQKIGRTIAEVILMPGQMVTVHGKVEKIGESLYIRGNVTKIP